MPLYEYQCQDCNETTEFLQKVSDVPKTQCPHCQSETLSRIISPAGFRLKGTGWYETDFKTKPTSKTPTKESGTTNQQSSKKDE